MTLEIGLVLAILAVALVLFITEAIRMDLVALLVLAALTLTRLVSPAAALAGFSNAAVVTVWAMFILSAGLTRTGVAETIGSRLLGWVGRGEKRMIAVIMLTAALLSAFMNNIGVAAMMLPVVLNVARRTATPPSRLLMPLAYGSLLGGLATLIGTPPNLLVSDSLREYGFEPFTMFDYTPVGGAVMLAGVAMVVLVGRHLLPRRDPGREASVSSPHELQKQYQLDERSAVVRLPQGSPLSGRTLEESRLGSATGLNVYAVLRGEKPLLAPGPETVLREGDRLLVGGKLDRFIEMRGWSQLKVEEGDPGLDTLVSNEVGLAELRVAPGASVAGRTLGQLDFRKQWGAIVLAIRRDGALAYLNLAAMPLREGDRLLVQGRRDDLVSLREAEDFQGSADVSEAELSRGYQLRERIFTIRVSAGSLLAGRGLAESRIGDALGVGVLGLHRRNMTMLLPEADEQLHAGDVLLVRGRRDDLVVFQGLQDLSIESETAPELRQLESEQDGLVEAMLSPRTSLAGKTPTELRFRERYGLQILALLRQGEVHRSNLRNRALRFGDALLLLGPREKQLLLARDPDFLMLTEKLEPTPQRRLAPVAALIMAGVVAPVLLGWLPIAISAVAGAALMILAGCLSMDDAYHAIEWRAIFLIAGMLPLGTALQETGAAALLTEQLLGLVGPLGPQAVLVTLYLVTAAATMFIPTAALVVLMAPIAMKACSAMGISPHAVMMAVAMAASASFTSPVSHPANVLVMGPGGYRFSDYVKLGVPLTLFVLIVVLLVLPLFWPLQT